MQNIDTILTLDVYDYDLSPSTMKAIALDSNTRSVTAYITRNGQPYDVGQSDVTLTVIRPDGVGAQVTGEAYEYETSVEDTTVTRHGAYAELSQAALAVSGTLLAQFMFTSGEQILRTEIFTINVGKALDASTSTWAGEYQGYNLDELVQSVNESSAKVDAMEQDVSELKSGLSKIESGAKEADAFLTVNDFDGNSGKHNVIQSPYTTSDILASSLIMSNGTISTGSSYGTSFVSPLIPVTSGTYGLKVVRDPTYPNIGNIHSGNSYKNGYTFVAEDGETIVARPSLMQVVSTDIYIFDVPTGAKYVRFCVRLNTASDVQLARALNYFNQWILLPDADDSITDDFFDIGEAKEDGEIDRIQRSDGSYLALKDTTARSDIQRIDANIAELEFDDVKAFMRLNNIGSEMTNLLGLPYADNEVIKFAGILSSGAIRNNKNNNDRNLSLTPLIPVESGATYALYVPSGNGYASKGQLHTTNDGYGLFASNGETPVAKTSFIDLGNGIFLIKITDGAKYIRFVFYHGPANSDVFSDENVALGLSYVNKNWMMIKSDSTELTPSDFVRKPDEGIYRIVRADGSLLNFSQAGLSDKKILVFGDSIWGNDRSCGISDYLAEYSGATIYNCAIGGTRITGDRNGQPDWRAFDGENLITAKLTNTWTDQDTYASDVVYYVATETLPLLKSVDLSDIDVLILAYGHNDFASDHTISSVVTAYENVITAILTAYPSIRILVCAPPWRMFSGGDGDTYTNGNGDTIKDMDDALVTMAKTKHIAVLNTLEEVPWSALTASYYLDSDSVHPNFEGNKVYAHVVNGKLRNMY